MRLLLAALVLPACSWKLERMMEQPRCERDEPTALFEDGRCNRLPPEGTVPWRGGPRPPDVRIAGQPERASADLTGLANEPFAPPPPTRALVERGRTRFETFCAACHGLTGDGRSQVAENMAERPPPALVEPPVTGRSDRYLFEVITAGFGVMPSYASELPVADRWAVVSYLRVLALRRDVGLDELPPAVRAEAVSWLR